MSKSWEYTKGLSRQAMFNLLSQCLLGEVVYMSDVEHVFNVYGDTYRREVNTTLWKPYDDSGEPINLPDKVWVVTPLRYFPSNDEPLRIIYKVQDVNIGSLDDLLRINSLYGILFRTKEQAEKYRDSMRGDR